MRWLSCEEGIIRTLFLAAVILLIGSTSAECGCPRYYVIVFGSQRMPPNPRFAHTFAVYIKVCDSPTGRIVKYHTISWLAEDGLVRMNTFFPEPGRFWGLHETMDWVLSTGQRVSAWGPYEVDRRLYYKSLRQIDKFHRWNTKYKAVDSGYPTFWVSNCIHAASAVAGLDRLRVLSPSWGETASYAVVQRYKRFMMKPRIRHCRLIRELKLDKYPIIYREMRPPRSGAIWTLIRGVSNSTQ